MGRPTKENSLSPKDVVNAAIACLDELGEAGLGVNRVARKLGIKPPAIYKHVPGKAGLRRAVALSIWRQYLSFCQEQMEDLQDPKTLLRTGARVTRGFARQYPARYAVMMQYQMRSTDPEEAEIIQASLKFFQRSLHLYDLSETALIDCMRMINAATYGFIMREQADLMTLSRSSEDSYEVMLEALLIAVEYIRNRQPAGE